MLLVDCALTEWQKQDSIQSVIKIYLPYDMCPALNPCSYWMPLSSPPLISCKLHLSLRKASLWTLALLHFPCIKFTVKSNTYLVSVTHHGQHYSAWFLNTAHEWQHGLTKCLRKSSMSKLPVWEGRGNFGFWCVHFLPSVRFIHLFHALFFVFGVLWKWTAWWLSW